MDTIVGVLVSHVPLLPLPIINRTHCQVVLIYIEYMYE